MVQKCRQFLRLEGILDRMECGLTRFARRSYLTKPWQTLHRSSTDYEQFHASHIISSWMTSHSYWSNWSDTETNFRIFPASNSISLGWFKVENLSHRSLHDTHNSITNKVTGAIHILLFAVLVWQMDNSKLSEGTSTLHWCFVTEGRNISLLAMQVFKWPAQAGGSTRNKEHNKTACNGEEVPPLNSLMAYETRSSEKN
jgi:hypothetical protein